MHHPLPLSWFSMFREGTGLFFPSKLLKYNLLLYTFPISVMNWQLSTITIFKILLTFYNVRNAFVLNYVLYKIKTRAAVVPIAILFCRCFSPLLQSSRVLVYSVPPGSLTLLRYLFVFCTASLQPQTSPSPPTPCSSSFFFFFCGFCPRRVFYTSLFRHLTQSTCPGPRTSFSFSR